MKVRTRVTIYTLFAIACVLMSFWHGLQAYLSGLDPDPVNAPICVAFLVSAFLFWVLRIEVRELKDPVKRSWE